MDGRGKPKKVKAEARQPLARKSSKDPVGNGDVEKRLAEALDQLQTRNRELAEAHEQQTATSEILRVISQSRTDVQPVFDAIVQSAVRLLRAHSGMLLLSQIAGEQLELTAFTSISETYDSAVRTYWPRPLNSHGAHTLAIRDREPVNIADVASDPRVPEDGRAVVRVHDIRSVVSVPLLWHGEAIGTIAVNRREAGGFTGDEIGLLKTFADQAVIAIENVRLFTELEARNADLTEGLERETATGEILRVISSSPTDVQPVLDTVVKSAARLCDAYDAQIFRRVGDQLFFVAHHGPMPSGPPGEFTVPLVRGTTSGRSVLEGLPVHVADLQAERDAFPEGSEIARQQGHRTTLSLPLVREGVAIGTISARRAEIRPFTERQIALLKTFADQAVIAIENVRLFTELQTSNHELTTALDTQTATSDILRVISRSQTDVQPVFDTIVQSAVRLLRGFTGGLYQMAGDQIVLAAHTSIDNEGDAAMRASFPRSLQSAPVYAQVLREHAPVTITDAFTDPRQSEVQRATARSRGYRSSTMVPLLRHDEAIGTIAVTRREPGGFTADEIALLQTFADQAVIAIENVRLFREIEDKSRQLEVASQHKSEFLANMSHELRTPLNAIIGYSEMLEEDAADLDGGRLVPDLQKIATAAKHQLSLINDILDLSKIEAGRMELELSEFNLPNAIDNALVLVRERANRRGIKLGSIIDERLGTIGGDERKVKQVLLNLLSNALKFTPEGGRIDVSARVHDEAAEVSVTDTGIGIAPADQEAVFEEFRQVGMAEKKVEGTGLGLALSRKFVELHGGRIWVQSQLGEGSTFTFTLPVRREE